MYFDPLSAWLVALISNGIAIVDEKSKTGTIDEYHRKNIEQYNRFLNADIRRIKERHGVAYPEAAYNEIQIHIKATQRNLSFHQGQINIDLENQEFIISLLEECAKYYSEFSSEKFHQKAEWFKNAAIEARQKKEQYAKKLEENRIKEEKEREKQQTTSKILLVIGLVVFVGFVIFFFS